MVPAIHHCINRCHHHQQRVRVQDSLSSSILPSPCSLPTFCAFCVGRLPLKPTCTTSVCALLQIVSKSRPYSPCGQIRGPFWFLNLVFPMFHSTLQVLKTTTCTIAPHTEHQFRNPTPCPSHPQHVGNCAFWHPFVIFESASTSPVCAKHKGHHSLLQVLLLFRVEYLSSCQHFGWSTCRILIPLFSLHPPIHGLRPLSSLQRRIGFRLNICVPETRVAAEWPISQMHCSWAVFNSCPRPPWGLLHFLFPASPFTLDIGAPLFGRLSNYIFWHKFPKHTFLSPLPWRLPGSAIRPLHWGAPLIRNVPRKRGNSRSTGVWSDR